MPGKSWTIPPYETRAVPDGGRWFIVYHDGDEESSVTLPGGGFVKLGSTSGTWQVASSAASRDVPMAECDA